MEEVKVKLENCYGIKALDFTFDFRSKRVYVIYAPNGMMKTSFAETFKNLSEGEDSKDRIYQDREPKRIIEDENGKELDANEIFVIEPYDEHYTSKKIPTLLADKKLTERYREIHESIDAKKETLLKELQNRSGLKNNVEEIISETLVFDKNAIFTALNTLRTEVAEDKKDDFVNVTYNVIFNDKVGAVLETKGFKEKLEEYIEIYDKLMSDSTFFKKGVFNHNNAADIAKNLKNGGWFEANHTVSITTNGEKKEIKTEAELTEVIEQEKQSILENEDLAKLFEEIDKKLSKNSDVKNFRTYIEENKFILPELRNPNKLKRTLWVAYLTESRSLFDDLMKEYDDGKTEIDKIIQEAKKEAPKWGEVINIFNERFSVPFKVSMGNRDDVILKSEAPVIEFEFSDSPEGKRVPIERGSLLESLSNGEKRALYILNIIFEVEARKEQGQTTLFIIDDIADSFDYKNKYAIIEYLKDISNEDMFYQIILSHNFDFYRTISGRLDTGRKYRFHTIKTDDSIKLVEEKYQKNPFNYWKEHIADRNDMLVASIPFVRNLAEYCGFDDHFEKLTSLLHVKDDTNSITIGELESIMNEVVQGLPPFNQEKDKLVKNLIYDTANLIGRETDEMMDLEKKIVLSIAIRLKAEDFLVPKRISTDKIKKNQTFKLIEEYKNNPSADSNNITLLEEVGLMTPEGIHINSFMYEPILDMDSVHLKKLYCKVSKLSD